MGNSLNKDSVMECPRHGIRPPSFVCEHLQYGAGIGFYQPDDEQDPEWPFKDAWCGACDKVLMEQGEWNAVSEGQSQMIAICEGCYEEIRERNS